MLMAHISQWLNSKVIYFSELFLIFYLKNVLFLYQEKENTSLK